MDSKLLDKVNKHLVKRHVMAVIVYKNGRIKEITQKNFEDITKRGSVYTKIHGGRQVICCDKD